MLILVKTKNEINKIHLKKEVFLGWKLCFSFKNISRKKQDKNNYAAHCFFMSESYHDAWPWHDTKIVTRLCQETRLFSSQDEITQKLLKNTPVLLKIVILRHLKFNVQKCGASWNHFPGDTSFIRIKESYHLEVR